MVINMLSISPSLKKITAVLLLAAGSQLMIGCSQQHVKPPSAKSTHIGRVIKVVDPSRIAVVQLDASAPERGSVLISMGQSGPNANLLFTGEAKQGMLAVDIQSGNPHIGDSVVLYKGLAQGIVPKPETKITLDNKPLMVNLNDKDVKNAPPADTSEAIDHEETERQQVEALLNQTPRNLP